MSGSIDVAEPGFRPMLSIGMGIEVFASNWLYCDRLSSYVARMISHNRTDSLLYANLLSSALNELLETINRAHGPEGQLTCRVFRNGPSDLIEFDIPADAATWDFFKDAAALLGREDLAEHYRSALLADGPLDPRIGLFELAVDYGARISVERGADELVRLSAVLSLEGNPASA